MKIINKGESVVCCGVEENKWKEEKRRENEVDPIAAHGPFSRDSLDGGVGPIAQRIIDSSLLS